jgi:hypothetical protein
MGFIHTLIACSIAGMVLHLAAGAVQWQRSTDFGATAWPLSQPSSRFTDSHNAPVMPLRGKRLLRGYSSRVG